MAWMLGKNFYIEHRIKLPNGGCVWGLRIPERQARRIKRAREKAAWNKTERNGTGWHGEAS